MSSTPWPWNVIWPVKNFNFNAYWAIAATSWVNPICQEEDWNIVNKKNADERNNPLKEKIWIESFIYLSLSNVCEFKRMFPQSFWIVEATAI